ncbi:hypothetical protein [Arthrobacter sp. UYEF3]|uniref:hypothetical protein n=1 Tax=Arthrobacter sp. UYEF3 TaxID=1756365 RepID=UPI0033963D9E
MPSLAGADPLGAGQFVVLVLLVAAAAACCVYLVRKHQASDGGLPDAVFWDGFAGLAVVGPAVLLPSLVSPWAGLILTAVAGTTAAASYRWTPGLLRWQEAGRAARDAAAVDAAAARRHREVLARWRRYELDPAFCIDFPAMSDPTRPETAAFLKAMKAADHVRGGVGPGAGDGSGYSAAVERLERSLAAAERAAGAGHISAELHNSTEGAR